MSKPISIKILFESLHREYYAMVLQMAMGYMKGDTDLAKDITQEVFINIWNALPKFKGDSSHKTWIYRITVNTCLLYIRSNKYKANPSIEAVEDFRTNEQPETEDIHSALYKAIGELAQLDRLIIMMVLDDLEYDQISTITAINPINLRVKIHRIKKKLSQLLKLEISNG